MGMKVRTLVPHGYCLGVNSALTLALKAKKDHPDQDVYLLGLLVHNEEAMDFLVDRGLIPIDERKTPLLDAILGMKRGDVVVFSAHGHPEAYDDLAKEKGLVVYDATCRYVKENLECGLKAPTPVLYIGVEGHLESEAFLANCPEATFYDVKSRRSDLIGLRGKTATPTIITQTTLSSLEVEDALNQIRAIFPHAVLTKERCHSTSLRQKAIQDLPSEVDALIVLGSTRSNNSVKLAELGRAKGIDTYLCLGLEDVMKLNLENKKEVALSSGASTSEATYQAVLTYLCSQA